MFSSILTETVSGITFQQILICFCGSICSGLIISLFYRSSMRASRAFLITTAILPSIVMTVIMMVNGNLGVGIAVAGSFSLVRFRSMEGRSSDIAVIFAAMAAGLACGMGYVTFAMVLSLMICMAGWVLSHLNLFGQNQNLRFLSITIPEDLNFAEAFQDLFASYTKKSRLTEIRTINLGSLYELHYEVTLNHPEEEKEFMDQIRTRNGNLTVRSTLMAPVSTEL